MISRLMFGRLLLPYLAIVGISICLVLLAAVIVLAIHEQPVAGLTWFAMLILIASGVACWFVARDYNRKHSVEVLSAFGRAIGDTSTDLKANDIDETIALLVATVDQRFMRASRDKAQLLTIISSMSDGLIAMDDQQRILLTNRAAEQLIGISPGAIGHPLWEATSHGDLIKAASQAMLTARDTTIAMGPLEGKYVEATVRRLPVSERPGGLIIMIHDVTDMMNFQELRKEFVANVSHELRTPLTVINGFIETLRDGAMEDPQRAQHYLETVQRHTQQLTNLVNDLLDLSRLDSTENLPDNAPILVEPVLQKVFELMHPAARSKEQTLSMQIEPNLPLVMGDANSLMRAIGNLVDNAIKYTKEGGEIDVEASQQNQELIIRVCDNGIGMDEEDLPRIFERFYRVDRSRSREMGGTGLGLSIVKHIVQGHHGTVQVNSTPGRGSRFTIHLPVIAQAPQNDIDHHINVELRKS
jgi:two-component system phosphate regulon sensor histidine kinase PhoR